MKEEVSSYWMILMKREYTGNWRGSNRSHLVPKGLWKTLWTSRRQ